MISNVDGDSLESGKRQHHHKLAITIYFALDGDLKCFD